MAQAGEDLDMVANADLILDEAGGDIGAVARRAAERAEPQINRWCNERIGERHADPRRVGGGAEEADVALDAGGLAAEFDAGEDDMVQRPGAGGPDKVGLAEQILALVGVIICLDAEAAGADGGDGEDVAIEFVIVAIAAAMAQGQMLGKGVIGSDRDDIGVETGGVDIGAAKKSVAIAGERTAIFGRDATIGDAVVAGMFIAKDKVALAAEVEPQGRVDCPAFHVENLAVIGAVFVKGVEAGADAGGERGVEIGTDAPGAERVDRGIGSKPGGGVRRLGDTVDDAAAAAAAEHHGVGAHQDLQPLGVVEVAIILDVVAHAIDEEAAGRIVTAQGWLVAVAFPLAGGGAGDKAQRVGDGQHRLIIKPIAAEDVDRLRHIDQRRIGAGRGAGGGNVIALVTRRSDGDQPGIIVRGLRRHWQHEQGRRHQQGNAH